MTRHRLVIDELVAADVGGSRQYLLIRSRRPGAPVLLLLQQGPGLPMISEAAAFDSATRLEDDFTVVYWDQRGCGRSALAAHRAGSLTVARAVEDTLEVADLLKRRFAVPTILVAGFSFGGAVAALAAGHRPADFAAVVTMGMDVDFAANERFMHDSLASAAAAPGRRGLARALARLGPPPHLDRRRFNTRARLLADLGGVNRRETYRSLLATTVARLVRSPHYGALDIARTFQGMNLVIDGLLPDMAGLDLCARLPRIEAPIVMGHGRFDRISDPAVAERYFAGLDAPAGKRFVWFEHSAHMPQAEEPERFADVVRGALPAAVPLRS
jgi:pimeloyl-ACP methyl ester carboxylesterase